MSSPFEKASKKLVVPQTLDGKRDFPYIKGLKRLDEILSKDPAHVGIAPIGSRSIGMSSEDLYPEASSRGYQKTVSDYDYVQIIDYKKGKAAAGGDVSFHRTMEAEIEELNSELGTSFHLLTPREIGPHLVHVDFIRDMEGKRNIRAEDKYERFVAVSAALSRRCTGNDIAQWRERMADVILSQGKRRQNKIIADIVSLLVWKESRNKHKYERRSNVPFEQIMSPREQMWKRKVENLISARKPEFDQLHGGGLKRILSRLQR
ncbi:hypothetical protein HY968_03130 [Candidatus Kaiserbacteria bacterium]|nr:hypothetical protein [Candidatus Kaiserbacteria bacterium]